MREHNKKRPTSKLLLLNQSSLKKKESWSCNFPSWEEYYEQSSEHTRKAFILLSLSVQESLTLQGQNASSQKNCKSRNLFFSHMTNRISWYRVSSFVMQCTDHLCMWLGSKKYWQNASELFPFILREFKEVQCPERNLGGTQNHGAL